jgi:hypothetical protein
LLDSPLLLPFESEVEMILLRNHFSQSIRRKEKKNY